MPRKSAAEKAEEEKAAAAEAADAALDDDGFVDTDGDGADDSDEKDAADEAADPDADDEPGADELDEEQADAVRLTDDALDDADEPPDDYDPLVAYEDTAPPGEEPGNDAIETARLNTSAEEALIERNQRRYDLRTSGLSSAEVNEIEEDERAASRS